MKMLLASLAVAAAMISPSQAEVRNYAQSGYWTNYSGAGDDDTPICGIQSATPGDVIAAIHFRWVAGRYRMVVMKNTWRLKDGEVPVVIGFDGHDLPGVKARGYTANVAGSTFGILEIDVGTTKGSAERVMDDVGGASEMTVHFPTGTEKTWTFPMVGSKAAVRNMAVCVGTMAAIYNIPLFAAPGSAPVTPAPAPQQRKRQPYESDI